MSEFDFEPIRGLPELLPDGEELRWQGAPRWGALALRAFHVRAIAIYFVLLILTSSVLMLINDQPLARVLQSAGWLLFLGGAAMAILTLLAWLYARSTVYSITSRRVVIRFGLAIPIAVNIPFKSIETAGLRVFADGTGDIPLALIKEQRVSYLIMWPNVRPWHFLKAQPMLRALADVETAAAILAEALNAASSDPSAQSIDQQAATAPDAAATTGLASATSS